MWSKIGRNHCMLHLRIKMRSGGCVASSQNDDDDTGVGVSGVKAPWSVRSAPVILASVCVQADVSRCPMC
jgi:hypothetical protein